MAKELCLPPSASALSESLRDLGYSLETAIADVIDNSISADSTEVSIFCLLNSKEPQMAIIDDGHGMSSQELIGAMKHGSRNPNDIRGENDLGRFGLGLKTASFSQCRQLTVVTRKNDEISAAQWDLDVVDQRDEWIINILDEEEISELGFNEYLNKNGTIVIWRKLDRMFEALSGDVRESLVNEKLAILGKHLSLVFHRFLTPDEVIKTKLKVKINGHQITAFDPFCRKIKATQMMPEEKVIVENNTVRIQPYILPHHSKLTATEYEFYQNRSDFLSNQGAYIYRNGRLMAWGDWFRMAAKGESTKLARVQIDFNNSLDEDWTIDIKKSRASPPKQVRERMKQILQKIINRSTDVHRRRGKRLFDESACPLWERYAEFDNIRYEINMQHPLIISLTNNSTNEKNIKIILNAISASLPLEMIYSDFSLSPKEMLKPKIDDNDLINSLDKIKELLKTSGIVDAEQYKSLVLSTGLFAGREAAIDEYINKEFYE
ncbi:ATP-binding protein [Rahnella sp. Lac-M11]|uniref:ATP-binding protein n=1 Tax=Rahnella contaminans TaxID=2703882 RepID=A0A6M2B2E9_9GAMM|nr:ATP-binding protein [Rahnella contaminans]NGX87416.1 ATP-binding protein [Rahnella contaminans]